MVEASRLKSQGARFRSCTLATMPWMRLYDGFCIFAVILVLISPKPLPIRNVDASRPWKACARSRSVWLPPFLEPAHIHFPQPTPDTPPFTDSMFIFFHTVVERDESVTWWWYCIQSCPYFSHWLQRTRLFPSFIKGGDKEGQLPADQIGKTRFKCRCPLDSSLVGHDLKHNFYSEFRLLSCSTNSFGHDSNQTNFSRSLLLKRFGNHD